jgi:4-amino-4-deoxy-L-arabinose transferase
MAKLTILLVGAFVFLYVVPLGVRPLMAPDETRYAEISREMLESGDWIVPHLNGLRYFEKPVLGYWLNAASIRLLGENAFAVRLPTAFAVGLTALLLGLWARRFSNDRLIGLGAVAVFLLSFEVFILGVFCVLDSFFSLFITGTIVSFFFADRQKVPFRRFGLLALAGVSCGLAFLTKGFLAFVIPAIILVPFALWEGRLKAYLKMLWVPAIAAVLVALPWSVMVYHREPDFWRYFVLVEHFGRFVSPDRNQHAKPLWYYVPVILGGAMPWTPLVGTIVQGLRHTGMKNPMVRLAICWAVLPFLFFSLSSGKLGTYVLPCFPPLAFLIVVGLLKCLRQGDTKGFVTGAWVLTTGAVITFSVMVVALLVDLGGLRSSTGGWRWAIVASGLLVGTALALAAIRQKNVHKRLAFYWAAPVLFLFSWHFVAAALASSEKMPGPFLLSDVGCGTNPKCMLFADDHLVAAACWFYKRSDISIYPGRGEYAYGLGYEDSKQRFLDTPQFNRLIADSAGVRCITFLTSNARYDDLKADLPQPLGAHTDGSLILVEFTPCNTRKGELAQTRPANTSRND